MEASRKHIIIALILTLGYTLIASYYIGEEKYLGLLIPALLMAGLIVFVRMDLALLASFFLVPVSVPLREYFPQLNIDMYLPTEPLLVLLTFLFITKFILEKKPDRRIFSHPVSLTVFFSLFWILMTSVTSSIPAVSFKFLASRIWFVVPFYFMSIILFSRVKNIRSFIALYAAALIIVIVYTLAKHSAYGLNDQEASNWVCSPFYNDHTAYGAALAIMVFALGGLILVKSTPLWLKNAGLFTLGIVLIALVFSYSRAAWVSVVGALGALVLVLLRIRFRWVALSSLILIGGFILFYSNLMYRLEKNNQDSSGNFSQHITSITNISTDASNVERLNRWNSAIRMFRERPVFGWGPGTYTFQYAPFQFDREKTIISTNFGDGGNAHSEYLGPLAESGLLGPIYFLLIGIFGLLTGFRVYHRSKEKDVRTLALFLTLGLITYLLHAFLNNFLDTDKLSALFWGTMAALVSLDLYHTNLLQPDPNPEKPSE